MTATDAAHMGAALAAARRALLAGEVPVGACLVRGEHRVAAHNGVISSGDPTAHAELEVIRTAARDWRRWPADPGRLYVTVEPCPMCIGACHYAGIREIVFAAGLNDFHRITGTELLAPLASDALLRGGCCREDSLELLRTWAERRSTT
jgi:tRNA(Arg) A34 adenosine deaminase TadA